MNDYYITKNNRNDLINQIKLEISIIQDLKELDFTFLSDLELGAILEKVKSTSDLLSDLQTIEKRKTSTREANIPLLIRMSKIFNYEIGNIENMTDGEIWMHLQKLLKIQKEKRIKTQIQ